MKQLTRFKAWFFKGRIEKKEIVDKRIDALSQEYNDGNTLEVVQW